MKIESIIRKISIGRDYKNDAMHYSVDQDAYGGHKIDSIIEEEDGGYTIWIKKGNELLPWKKFNRNMAVAIEYDLLY